MRIYKKGRFWYADYFVGAERIRQSTGATRRADAQAWANAIGVARQMPTFESAVEVLRQIYSLPPEGNIALDAIYDRYADLAKSIGRNVLSDETIRKRRGCVQRLVTWLKAKRPAVKCAEHITGPVAAGFAAELLSEGLKTKTRKNIIGDLSSVWRVLEKADERISNPWEHLAPQDTDSERGQAFTADEEERVLEAAKAVGKDWWPICVIMRHTGLRYGDVANLRWAEINGDILKHKPIKTRRHNIEVILPLIEPVKEALKTIPSTGDFLFPVHAELYKHRGAKWRCGLRFSEVLERAGISGKGYTIHSWRHTAATRLAEAGADIETRKRILGHTVDTTAERYDHASHVESTREALERTLNLTAGEARK